MASRDRFNQSRRIASVTTTVLEDEEIGAALAMLWQRHRQANLDRIALLELTAANVLRATTDEDAIAEGAQAAHKLAGSLGTFGFDAGSRAALEAESLLREPVIDARLLAEAVAALRASVEDRSDASAVATHHAPSGMTTARSAPTTQIASLDADLIARVTVEGAALGLTIVSSSEPPWMNTMNTYLPRVVIVDDAGRSWTREDMLHSVTELSLSSLVVVLTDRETLEERMEFGRAGVAGVMHRSHGARQIISFVAQLLAQRNVMQSVVLAFNVTSTITEALGGALLASDGRVEVCDDASHLWEALEERGADLVLVGYEGAEAGGPDLCRVIRAHPRWHRLPLVVVGDRKRGHFDEAMLSGADEYVSDKAPAYELSKRLHVHIERGRLTKARAETDPLTGTENRPATERSLDRLLRLASRRSDPFSFVLIVVDQFDQICEVEGNAFGDVVLRHLGGWLLRSFRGEDVVGRWTHDGFAVGVYGAGGEQARERIAEVLKAFAEEEFPTTSSRMGRYTCSAGVATCPSDGSTLSSLLRLGETALRRAKVTKDFVVLSGSRPEGRPANVVDVVLVEDDDSVADVVEHALSLRNFEFVRFSDGAEAANALGEQRVKCRVVLLDVGLPSLDGFGVLQHLRRAGVLAETRVMMLTARSTEAETLRALGLGATEHITKPFSIPLLLGRLDQTLSRSVS
jgi:diguanylate cyclase (GGDEF)-like protein